MERHVREIVISYMRNPNMCNDKTCADGTAYCCEVDCKDFGGKRACSES